MNPKENNYDPSDPMMDELQKIREQIGEKTSKMSTEETMIWYREEAQKAVSSLGRVLVPHPTVPNASVMALQEDLRASSRERRVGAPPWVRVTTATNSRTAW